jgi:hypothetical protein
VFVAIRMNSTRNNGIRVAEEIREATEESLVIQRRFLLENVPAWGDLVNDL